ncbi:hypothetical protein JW930_00985 [Candidatus Woesearchaeota archaeon]|nr:hypothetical protein [Candidatus Woesearchaeota archaeon]
MEKRLGQISMEYVILFSFVTIFVIAGLYLFREFAVGASDSITEQRVNKVANFIIDNAREMYYQGAPSKTTLEVDMPDQIANAGVLSSGDEWLLIFVVNTGQGETSFYYESDVALKVCVDSSTSDASIDCSGSVDCAETLDDQCSPPSTCECFDKRFYSPGLKNIQIKADNTLCSPACVTITNV